MTQRPPVHNLQVANELYEFVNQEVLPEVGVAPDAFWHGFSDIVTELAPKNLALLAERGILAAPGDFYGPAGRQHVRIALTATDERIEAAVRRLG